MKELLLQPPFVEPMIPVDSYRRSSYYVQLESITHAPTNACDALWPPTPPLFRPLHAPQPANACGAMPSHRTKRRAPATPRDLEALGAFATEAGRAEPGNSSSPGNGASGTSGGIAGGRRAPDTLAKAGGPPSCWRKCRQRKPPKAVKASSPAARWGQPWRAVAQRAEKRAK